MSHHYQPGSDYHSIWPYRSHTSDQYQDSNNEYPYSNNQRRRRLDYFEYHHEQRCP
jgi:hypothetical protein